MNINPYNICSLDQKSDCKNCINYKKLHCKKDKNTLKISLLVVFSTIIISFFGISITAIITGLLWPPVVYIIFVILFFMVIEIRLTCSHCPFYAEKTLRLHCLSNIIAPKIWRFHPEPMNKFEKIGSISGFTFLGLFPLLVEIYGIMYMISNNYEMTLLLFFSGIILITITLILVFFLIFLLLYCPCCPNFSCPFNKVPKKNVDEYLKRNPVLQNAWERNGYKIGKD